jgi:murein DD-endopeptidase MepM/ murein hydrolase activator NlpD
VLFWLLPVGSAGAPGAGQLQRKIAHKRALIGYHRGRERVFTADIAVYTRRINGLQSDITRLQARETRLEVSLEAKRAVLARVQEQLRQERLRLARLRARLAQARVALARRLVEIYKDGEPDLVTVVLNAHGFADLLERADFLHRVSAQDAHIIGVVRAAKADATATAKRLDALEHRQAQVAAAIQAQHDEVAGIKGQLVDRRGRFQRARASKARLLASTRSRRMTLEHDVAVLERQQEAIRARLAAAAGPGALKAGPVRPGSGGLIWPVNGPITSPFCEPRPWEACHPGIDIGVPAGTPVRAAGAGTVVLMQSEGQSGGYGNFICVQHAGPLSTCYAHLSSFATSMGAHVAQGQVIAYSGCTGRCFGPHLHFETRINGSVVNPMNYL